MYRFHVAIHAAPAKMPLATPTSIDARLVNALPTSPELLGIPLSISFEEAAQCLAALPRMYIEPDGSFVWVGNAENVDWQVDGVLYDREGRLLYIELKGSCPRSAFDDLLRAWGWPKTPLIFQVVPQAVYLAETDFRHWADGCIPTD
jgi:hypothetical protein